MQLTDIKSYRINDAIVWQAGESLDKLTAIINRELPRVGIRRTIDAVVIAAPISAPAVRELPIPTSVSKLTLAHGLFNPDKTRQENIQAFVRDLHLTPAGASTYYSQIKRNRLASTNR